ncbi:MAG: UbiA family prenyltransferase [candidate division Zixibacteria bacterium]|nr:UbiA family prenyltransferase [candidate division Zixibacteria bacterium]
MGKLFDHIFLARPVLLPPVWTILLLGYHRSVTLNGESGSIFLTFILLTFLSGAIYVLNQICDIETDRINRKLFLLPDNVISRKSAIVQTVIMNLVSIVPAFFISLTLGILFILGFILSYIYSAPPLVLKNRPFGGLLSNALGHGSLVFLIGWCANTNLSAKALLYSVPYLLAVGAIYLNTTIPDIEGDKKVGKITLAVKWGKFASKLFSGFLVLTALVFSVMLKDYFFSVVTFISAVFFVYMILSDNNQVIILATKIAVLGLSIVAGIFYIWYFILLLFVYIISKIYYRSRFNMNYPTLLGE